MSQTSERSSNFFSTKNSQRQLDINILQIFIKDHATRRDALAINIYRATGPFGRSADSRVVRINGNLRLSGKFLNKTADAVDTADTAVNFFPLSAGFSGGAFFAFGKIVFWRIFCLWVGVWLFCKS